MEAISNDGDFENTNPENWMEDVDLESHDHNDYYDELEKENESSSDEEEEDDDNNNLDLPPPII